MCPFCMSVRSACEVYLFSLSIWSGLLVKSACLVYLSCLSFQSICLVCQIGLVCLSSLLVWSICLVSQFNHLCSSSLLVNLVRPAYQLCLSGLPVQYVSSIYLFVSLLVRLLVCSTCLVFGQSVWFVCMVCLVRLSGLLV